MSLAAKLRRAPLRITTGAFILNTGLGKFSADDETAKNLHSMASGAYPVFEKIPPKAFVKTVAVGETVLGGALLLPLVPAGLAGLGLSGFAGALLGMWWRTPGMHEENSPRPTPRGVPIAKDLWMLGAGTSLVIDSVVTPVSDSAMRGRTRTRATLKAETKAARKSARRAAKSARRQAERVRSQAESVLPG